MSSLLPAIAERRARRAFASTPIDSNVQQSLWRAVSVAPSHGNSQPTRLVVVESEEGRHRVVAALSKGNQDWAQRAPLFAIMAAVPGGEKPILNADGTTREMWPFNAGIAAGNLMTQATYLGLNAHPMSGFDELAMRAAIEAAVDVRVVAVFAIGYPGNPDDLSEDLKAKEVAPQERLPMEILVGGERWHPEQGVTAKELRDRQIGAKS